MKKAVCALLLNKSGEILGVSRRNKPTDMNLPGGKVDLGESLEEACIREISEETGLQISNLELVFHLPCEGEETHDCYTFLADYEGTPVSRESGISVRWVTWDTLLKPSNSFASYNKKLFERMRHFGLEN